MEICKAIQPRARVSTLGNLAARDDLTAISLRNFDALTFNAWFIAFTLDSPQEASRWTASFRAELDGVGRGSRTVT